MEKSFHVGIILDGNRRYARNQGKKPWEGHRRGGDKVWELVKRWSFDLNIDQLTLYTFSMQNFQRDKLEVEFLFKLCKEFFSKIQKERKKPNFDDQGIKLNFIGRLHLFPQDIQDLMHQLMQDTKENSKLIVNFAMAYGGREEIIDGIKKIYSQIKDEKIDINQLTPELFSKYLYLENEPDLIIRTGGAVRTSNFLIWQSYYSEWFFIEKFWPDFTKEDLAEIINQFQSRDRRFGK